MFRKFIRKHTKAILQEIFTEYLKSENHKDEELIRHHRIGLKNDDGSLEQKLKMHSRGFTSLNMHVKYVSEFGTNEEYKLRSLQDIIKFEMSDINDDIVEVTDISFFPRSFHKKERLSCINMIPYGKSISYDNAEIVLSRAKDVIKKFPELNI